MKFIVADSGGSGTSLAFYDGPEDIRYMETAALHPKFLLQWPDDKLSGIRANLPEDLNAPLFFYGSGCSRPNIAYEVKQKLLAIGFSDVTVFPDTLGACRAVSAGGQAMVAILGTGSVLLGYDGETVTSVRGGFGALVGDEGSGMHFGKMLLNRLLNGKLSDGQTEDVLSRIGHIEQVRAELATHRAHEFVASIAERTASVDLDEIHRGNLELFLDNYFPIERNGILQVVGSYGFHRQKLLGELLEERGSRVGKVVKNPIAELVKFHRKTVF
jgi:glucosamine kinase